MKSSHSLFAVSSGRALKNMLTNPLMVGILSASVAFPSTAINELNQTSPTNETVTAIEDVDDNSGVAKNAMPSASAKEQLMARLANLSSLSSDFEQSVYDEEGTLLQEGAGSLLIQKPNKVRWHTQSPEESLIISDGDTLWFYDPFIEQVSAHNLQDAIANTPIMMLTNDDPSTWNDYVVSQSTKTSFIVTSKDPNSQVKSLAIDFDEAVLSAFTIADSTGQKSVISLKNIDNNAKPKSELFMFKTPEGVYLDDQR